MMTMWGQSDKITLTVMNLDRDIPQIQRITTSKIIMDRNNGQQDTAIIDHLPSSSSMNVNNIVYYLLPEEIFPEILLYLDVPTLIYMKQVSRKWREYCINAINNKRTPTKAKVFHSNGELRDAVKNYTKIKKNPQIAEEFAQTYGYPIGKWNVSNIKDFSFVFYGQYNFNEDINEWDVSNARDMLGMFLNATTFNKPLSNWKTSKVKTMEGMLEGAQAFNQSLSDFDTSQVTDMSFMFNNASSFNQDLSHLDTSQVKSMSHMFHGAKCFNQPLSSFDTSQVTDMSWMFCEASAFNQNLSNWDTKQVTDMTSMFQNCNIIQSKKL